MSAYDNQSPAIKCQLMIINHLLSNVSLW